MSPEDEAKCYIKPTDGVRWGSPRTIAELIAQLETMNPDLPVHGAIHVTIDDKRRAKARHLSMSWERVKGQFIDERSDEPYALVFWTQKDERSPPTPEEKPPIKLPAQRQAVLLEMAQHDPESGVPGFHNLACNLAIDETSVKRAVRGLARMGLAKRTPLFDTDDGKIMGSGYVLTNAGIALAAELGGGT